MFPWFWIWAPQFPFGQFTVAPETDWVVGNVASRNPGLERRIHQGVASYGSQIGWLTDLVLQMNGAGDITPADADDALRKLADARRRIETLKKGEGGTEEEALAAMRKLARENPDAFARVLQRLLPAQPQLPTRSG